LNIAIAVSPGRTVTLFDFAPPLFGLHVTEYDPGFSDKRTEDEVPFDAPLTENEQGPPTLTATNVPLAAAGAGAGFEPPDALFVVGSDAAAATGSALGAALAAALGAAEALAAGGSTLAAGGSAVTGGVGKFVGAAMTIAVLVGACDSFVVATSDEPCLRIKSTARTIATIKPIPQNASSTRSSLFCSFDAVTSAGRAIIVGACSRTGGGVAVGGSAGSCAVACSGIGSAYGCAAVIGADGRGSGIAGADAPAPGAANGY
jgi:hypothetical protein